MSNSTNYRQKYLDLKMRFMESVDVAFRMGFEQGAVQAQQDQMQQQQMQQEQMMQQQQGQPGQPGQGNETNARIGSEGFGAKGSPAGAEQMANPNGGDASQGSELDKHIAELESMLGKSEELDLTALKKTVNSLKALQVSQKEQLELRKSSMAIPAIAKALHKPAFKIGKQASHNMNDNAKQALSMQEEIVQNIMNKWESEEKKATKDIGSILNIEGLTKKD